MWWGYQTVEEFRWHVQPFWYNTCEWQTDRQTKLPWHIYALQHTVARKNEICMKLNFTAVRCKTAMAQRSPNGWSVGPWPSRLVLILEGHGRTRRWPDVVQHEQSLWWPLLFAAATWTNLDESDGRRTLTGKPRLVVYKGSIIWHHSTS